MYFKIKIGIRKKYLHERKIILYKSQSCEFNVVAY